MMMTPQDPIAKNLTGEGPSLSGGSSGLSNPLLQPLAKLALCLAETTCHAVHPVSLLL